MWFKAKIFDIASSFLEMPNKNIAGTEKGYRKKYYG
jgi:hypothetical protein